MKYFFVSILICIYQACRLGLGEGLFMLLVFILIYILKQIGKQWERAANFLQNY